VGWKIKVEGKALVYNSDLVDIIEKSEVLTGVGWYIGDGSAVRANLVRRRGDTLFGHTRISTQIHWCEKFAIKNIIFTHLGKETLREEGTFQVEYPGVTQAYDGLKIEI
jgi:phosphoribosyl 1,2-cyclic phosphodiesterase